MFDGLGWLGFAQDCILKVRVPVVPLAECELVDVLADIRDGSDGTGRRLSISFALSSDTPLSAQQIFIPQFEGISSHT